MKKNLLGLVLRWEGDNVVQEDISEKVLEALEPHPNIKTLCIDGFRGRCFPPWMENSTIENITKIVIKNCPNCLRIPSLGDLPRLKCLYVARIDALEYIMEEKVQVGIPIKPKFASLEELWLDFLPNLKGWSSKGSSEVGDFFPNLQQLHIWSCPCLRFPPVSSLKKLLVIRCSYLTLSSFSKLENLTSFLLEIDETYNIPIEMLENLYNLKELTIKGAHGNCLPLEGLKGLNSLARLKISLEKLTCLPEGWLPPLTSLEELSIFNSPEFVGLPEGIKYLHSLKILRLENLPKMVCLPEALQHISALEKLTITHCLGVASLPSSIQGMTNLHTLLIRQCPELMRRCEEGSGEDWHKIAHIPNLYIV